MYIKLRNDLYELICHLPFLLKTIVDILIFSCFYVGMTSWIFLGKIQRFLNRNIAIRLAWLRVVCLDMFAVMSSD